MYISSGCIYLQNLRFHAFHGVMEQEKSVGNDYVVNVIISADLSKAAISDDVSDTVNYASAYEIISETMTERTNLIENVAYCIGRNLFKRFPEIAELDVDVEKLNPPIGADCNCAGVKIHLINDKTILC